MGDVLDPIRARLASIQLGFSHVSVELSKPVQFIRRLDENTINEHICDVFTEAAKLISKISQDMPTPTKYIDVPKPEINALKLHLERLQTELDRKVRLFDNSVVVARKMFNDKLESLATEYKQKLAAYADENAKKEVEIEAELQELNNMFEIRLKSETAVHIQTIKQIEINIEKLKREFDLTQSTLTTSLEASEMRLALLRKQKETLEETNSQVTRTIHDKFHQQFEAIEEQHRIRIESLENEYNMLAKADEENQINFKNEIERLERELTNVDITLKNMHEEAIKELNLKFEKKMRKLDEKHAAKMADLKHQNELDTISSTSEAALITSQIENAKKTIADGDSRFKELLQTIVARTESILEEKEKEYKLMAKMHRKALEQLQQRHELNLDKEKQESQKTRYSLETKINQTTRDGEALRRRLESEITALTRARDKFEEEMNYKVAPPGQPPSSRPRPKRPLTPNIPMMSMTGTKVLVEKPPVRLSEDDEIERELQTRLRKFQNAEMREFQLIQRASEAFLKSANAATESSQSRMNASAALLASDELAKRRAQNAISTAEDLIKAAGKRDEKSWKEVEAALNAQIAEQQTTIMQLRDEVQTLRSDGCRPVALNVFVAANKEEIEGLQKRLDDLKRAHNERLQKIKDDYNAQIKAENDRSAAVIGEIDARIAALKAEASGINSAYKEESDKDHQHWMSMRKEMADSNNKILRLAKSRGASRPQTVSKSVAQRTLPKLK